MSNYVSRTEILYKQGSYEPISMRNDYYNTGFSSTAYVSRSDPIGNFSSMLVDNYINFLTGKFLIKSISYIQMIVLNDK